MVLDLSKMNAVRWVKPGQAWVEPGAKLSAIDRVARQSGWEIRMYPSTYRTATIGALLLAAAAALAPLTYGQLRGPGQSQRRAGGNPGRHPPA